MHEGATKNAVKMKMTGAKVRVVSFVSYNVVNELIIRVSVIVN